MFWSYFGLILWMLILLELNNIVNSKSIVEKIDALEYIKIDDTAITRMISTNSAPTFTTGLTAVIAQEWNSTTYSFPTVIDSENDSYTITIPSLDNGDAVPSWIVYNSNKLNINPPVNTVTSGDLKQFKWKILLTDSQGASNTYYLIIGVQHTAIPTKNLDISDTSISSPNNGTILLENYLSTTALNSVLTLMSVDTGANLPTWIKLIGTVIYIGGYTSSDFGKYQFFIVATNLCGQSYTSNTFMVILNPNYPPK